MRFGEGELAVDPAEREQFGHRILVVPVHRLQPLHEPHESLAYHLTHEGGHRAEVRVHRHGRGPDLFDQPPGAERGRPLLGEHTRRFVQQPTAYRVRRGGGASGIRG